jgi:hypothetical protein
VTAVVSFSSDTISRIDPLSNKVVDRTPVVGAQDVALGAGLVWVASCGSPDCT